MIQVAKNARLEPRPVLYLILVWPDIRECTVVCAACGVELQGHRAWNSRSVHLKGYVEEKVSERAALATLHTSVYQSERHDRLQEME